MIDLSDIKVIASEIDGVVTEHLSPIDELGNVLFKQYYMKDFEAINEIKKHYTFVFISKEQAINYSLCRRKNIPFFWSQNGDKKDAFVKMLRRYSVTPENVLYLGNSYSDTELMVMSQISVCPSDSVFEIKSVSDIVLENPGGYGVLCELFHILKKNMSEIL